jgi:hypothetical protein
MVARPRPSGPPKLRSIEESITVSDAAENLPVQAVAQENEDRTAAREMLLKGVMSDLSDLERQQYIGPLLDARSLIIGHWRSAEHSYLEAGRALIRLEGKIPARTWDRVLSDYDDKEAHKISSEAVLPFSRSTAQRLMAVARAVDERKFHDAFMEVGRTFDPGMLPPYSVAAMFANLDEKNMVKAVKADMIRGDVSQRAAISFLSGLKERTNNPIAGIRALDKTDKRIRKLLSELMVLKSQRAAILGELGMPDDHPIGGDPGSSMNRGHSATGPQILDLLPTSREDEPADRQEEGA